jgi:hypothetical protein
MTEQCDAEETCWVEKRKKRTVLEDQIQKKNGKK